MKRIEIEGSSPHFIGSWQIEQESICDALIEFFENHQEKHEPGASAGGVNVEAKNSTDVTIHPRDLKKAEYESVKDYIDVLYDFHKDYLKQFPFLASILPRVDLSSFNIQRYLSGGHFKQEHTERTSIVNSFRVLVWMTYLNDVIDGGCTTFAHQNLKVQPTKGKTLIWPAEWTHSHTGDVLNTGKKYIITGWMHFPHDSNSK